MLVGVSVAVAGRKPAPPTPLEIPDSLEGRAAMFSDALTRRDMEVLIRLTDPAQYRALRTWLAHGLPEPAQATDAKATDTGPKSEILGTVVTSSAGDLANVRVRLPAAAGGQELLLDEQWARRGEAWYFQPERLRSVSPSSHGPVRPYVKQQRRG